VLFGNSDRLTVAVAIARHPERAVNATDLSFELGMINSQVRAQLVALCKVGLLEQGAPGPGKRWYMRRECSFWQTCLDLFDEWT